MNIFRPKSLDTSMKFFLGYRLNTSIAVPKWIYTIMAFDTYSAHGRHQGPFLQHRVLVAVTHTHTHAHVRPFDIF